MKIYICSYDGEYGEGITLKQAFEDLLERNSDITVGDCIFLEAEEIRVEMKIERKEVPVKVDPNVFKKK